MAPSVNCAVRSLRARGLHHRVRQLLEDAVMERNADGYTGGSSGGAAGSSGGGFGNGGDVSGSAGYGASGSATTSSGSTLGGSSSGEGGGVTDRARDLAGTAKVKPADVGSSRREGAGDGSN